MQITNVLLCKFFCREYIQKAVWPTDESLGQSLRIGESSFCYEDVIITKDQEKQSQKVF